MDFVALGSHCARRGGLRRAGLALRKPAPAACGRRRRTRPRTPTGAPRVSHESHAPHRGRGPGRSFNLPEGRLSESVAKAPIEPGRRERIVGIPRFFSRPIPVRGAFATDLDVENVSACPAGACDPEFDWRPRGSALVAVLSASRPAGDPPAPVGAPRDLIRARGSPVNVLIRWAPTGAPTTRKAHHHDDRHRRDAHPGPIPATSRGSSRGSTPTRTPTTSRPAARRPARGWATCGSRRPRRATTSPATSSAPTGAFG